MCMDIVVETSPVPTGRGTGARAIPPTLGRPDAAQ